MECLENLPNSDRGLGKRHGRMLIQRLEKCLEHLRDAGASQRRDSAAASHLFGALTVTRPFVSRIRDCVPSVSRGFDRSRC